MNVVSTSPPGTEIYCALGVEPVAVSHACDYSPRVAELPSIDFSRVRGESSAERHDRVRTVGAEGRVYRLDVETLRSVEPDLILSQARRLHSPRRVRPTALRRREAAGGTRVSRRER